MSAHSGYVNGSHKALNNPNTSEESKLHSREVLEKAESGGEVESAFNSSGDKNPNNVAGGLKATLNNPNAFDEAKKSVEERLNKYGKRTLEDQNAPSDNGRER